jgi:TPR repeat protein
MHLISLKTATELTGLSKRTLWRRIAAGAIFKENGGGPLGRARVALEAIAGDVGVGLGETDMALVERADAGDPAAATDLALLFLAAAAPGKALFWLQSAAERGQADAMHLLGRCYIAGEAVTCDEAQGLSWIGRAAAQGHAIARLQMEGLSRRVPAPGGR